MKHVYTIEKCDPQLIFGTNDAYIQLYEDAFALKITARGNTLSFTGEEAHSVRFLSLLKELELQAQKKHSLSTEDVHLTLRLFKSHSDPNAVTDFSKFVILNTPSGTIKPKSENQLELVNAIKTHDITFSIGPAGTGKTYLSVALASAMLKDMRIKKIVLVRPVVEAGESLGFLPGDFREKINPYLQPLLDSLADFFPKEQLQKFMENETIEIVPLAYMRGRTLNNAFIILDEAQNATQDQMKMFLTRMGRSSKIVINGDDSQIDLPKSKRSGLIEAQKILKEIEGIRFVYFEKKDVVRHPLVQKIIFAYEKADA